MVALFLWVSTAFAYDPLFPKEAEPQSPRGLTKFGGKNLIEFPLALAYSQLNLCNIHTHTNAEHKGPGFTVDLGKHENGGYACNQTITQGELHSHDLVPSWDWDYKKC